MAALTATTPTRTGATVAGAPVAASDTISAAQLGSQGALLEIINGNASTNNVTISDDSVSPTGADATDVAASILTATNKVFKVVPQMLNAATRVVTITNSVTATVTYKLYPLG